MVTCVALFPLMFSYDSNSWNGCFFNKIIKVVLVSFCNSVFCCLFTLNACSQLGNSSLSISLEFCRYQSLVLKSTLRDCILKGKGGNTLQILLFYRNQFYSSKATLILSKMHANVFEDIVDILVVCQCYGLP